MGPDKIFEEEIIEAPLNVVVILRPNRSELCRHNCNEVQSYLRTGFPMFGPRCDKASVLMPLIPSLQTEDGYILIGE